jgi:hypothetical protein
MKKIALIALTVIGLSSCQVYKTVPNYVSSKELANVTIGQTKEQVRTTLGKTNPYDILAGWSRDCEVHQYKYKKGCKKLPAGDAELESGLTAGILQYEAESDVYLVYKNGKLSSLITDAGKKDLEALLDDVIAVKDACSEKGIRGCMDPESITYNKDAVISDGSCKYAPCGMKVNPNFNSKRPVSDCNQEFIPIKSPTTTVVAKPECSNCDFIEKLAANSNAKITINIGGTANTGMSAFSPSKKKTTISINDDDKANGDKNTSKKGEAKAAAKQKAEEARAAAKARAAEKKANRPKPNVFQ